MLVPLSSYRLQNLLPIDEGQLHVMPDAVSWGGADSGGRFTLVTNEVDETLLRIISSGIIITPGLNKAALASELSQGSRREQDCPLSNSARLQNDDR